MPIERRKSVPCCKDLPVRSKSLPMSAALLSNLLEISSARLVARSLRLLWTLLIFCLLRMRLRKAQRTVLLKRLMLRRRLLRRLPIKSGLFGEIFVIFCGTCLIRRPRSQMRKKPESRTIPKVTRESKRSMVQWKRFVPYGTPLSSR